MTRVRRCAVVVALFACVLSPPAGRADDELPDPILLNVTGPASVAQGAHYSFTVEITNPLPLDIQGRVEVAVLSPDHDRPVVLRSWFGRVPAQSASSFVRQLIPSQFFAALGGYTVRAHGDFSLTALPLGTIASPTQILQFSVTESPVPAPVFEDATTKVGITTQTHAGNLCHDYAAGAAWGDVNGDGLPDLYIPERNDGGQLWINVNGRYFTEAAPKYGVTNGNPDGTFPDGIGATFVDYDNDGHQDLFVLNDGVNRLYHNNGNDTFTDVAAAAGIADDANHASGSWADYDLDGYADLFVASYARGGCEQDKVPTPDHLYHNNGDGTFTDVTSLLPHSGSDMGLSFIGTWLDYNHSGRPSIFLGNDRLRPFDQWNYLWRNDGPGPDGRWQFTDQSKASRFGVPVNDMGHGVGDYDRDGNPDIAVAVIGPLLLEHNNGDGTFTNTARAAGIDRSDQGDGVIPQWWGLGFNDFQNDGWEDLYAVAGHIDLWTGDPPTRQPNAMFVNAGNGSFLDLSGPSRANNPDAGRGVAFADYDGDGLIDMFVVNVDGTPILYHNVTPNPGHWLEVRLIGRTSNRDSCGAQLTIDFFDQPPLTRTIFCGSIGLASGSDEMAHFGLGSVETVPKLTIRWPSGNTRTVINIPADRIITALEPITRR